MRICFGLTGRGLVAWTVLVATLPMGTASAQRNLPGTVASVHRHDPIDVDARPIVSRLPVLLVQPRRIVTTPEGVLFVADWGAGAVLRIARDGRVTVVAEGLDEPAGLALDSAGNLYVSTNAGGMTNAGAIVRISPMGEQSVVASGLTGPTALAVDAMDHLYVASFSDETISVVGMDGTVMVVAENVPSPAGMAFDETGTLFVVSSTEGTVSAVSPVGELTVVARGLLVPSDATFDSHGHLIVAGYAAGELTYVDRKGGLRTYALVPKGTVAAAFDRDGNVLLANWDESLLLKVTTELSVPCPHCEKRIRLRFRPRANKQTAPE